MSTITSTTQVVGDEMQLATDYRYINARGGRVGLSVAQAGDGPQVVVMHVASTQFHPDVSAKGDGSKLVQCALASIELDEASARTLHHLLGELLAHSAKD